MTRVAGAVCLATLPKSMTRAVDPVSLSAFRNTPAASRTVSTAWLWLIDPDASSTSVTGIPHSSVTGGFDTGVTAAEAGGATTTTTQAVAIRETTAADAHRRRRRVPAWTMPNLFLAKIRRVVPRR